MTITKLILMMVCLMFVTLGPNEAPKESEVTPLFSKDLPGFPAKEGLMITVEYPPAPQTPYIATTQMRLSMCLRAPSGCR